MLRVTLNAVVLINKLHVLARNRETMIVQIAHVFLYLESLDHLSFVSTAVATIIYRELLFALNSSMI